MRRDGNRRGDPDDEGDPPDSPSRPNHCAKQDPLNILEFRINEKINIADIPAWDGKGDTLVDYLSSMNDLASCSAMLNKGLATMVWRRWSGDVKEWWESHSDSTRDLLCSNWPNLMKAICDYFMDDKWRAARQKEFNDMIFCQKGHRFESPVQFVQRRKKLAMVIYPEDTNDLAMIIDFILRNIPGSWSPIPNTTSCSSTEALIA
ncbi:hypothetical protein VKT23_012326 [Stygiomarasmius scandens]|uniref:Uncharacterized protein n=1 Tax=Marasmiellus scandens TaxID=2682957 RepID=A0ABR1JC49_9AGAR